jgi:O-antigen ligase
LVDLRVEDFLMVLLLGAGFLRFAVRGREGALRLRLDSVDRVIFVYLGLAAVSTLLGLLVWELRPLRAMLFYLKEVEYFLFFFVSKLLVRDIRDVKWAIAGLLVGGLANGFFALQQLVTGRIGSADVLPVYRYYAVSALGESTPAVVGLYFLLVIIAGTACLFFVPSRFFKVVSFTSALLAVVGMVASLSRTALVGGLVVSPVLFSLLWLRGERRGWRGGVVVVLAVMFGLLGAGTTKLIEQEAPGLLARIAGLREDGVMDVYWRERVEEIHMEYLRLVRMSPIVGFGKSITGQEDILGVRLMGLLYGEAHNYYLRILVEMGIIGLFAFLVIVGRVLRVAYRACFSIQPYIRVIGVICFVYTVLMLIASLAVDAFVAARLAELLWIFVGVLVGASRLSTESGLRSSKRMDLVGSVCGAARRSLGSGSDVTRST